jgi:polar amino acid transport system substrate-binding protein
MPKTPLSFYLHMIAVAVVVFAVGNYFYSSRVAGEASISRDSDKAESVYDRVMRTGTIRCGYVVWPPSISKDPNTGQLSGLMYDYMNALGEATGLKIEWTEELNLATYIQDLNSKKYDLECSGGWPNGKRGKELGYSQPIYYFPIVAVTRTNDNRFDNNLSAINSSDVKVATIDGETSDQIRARRFPLSDQISLPPLSPLSDLMLQVGTGKADVTFYALPSVLKFMESNPNQIKIIAGEPVRTIANNTSFAKNEFQLQQLLNIATQELLQDGVIDAILKKYDDNSGAFIRVATPYQLPTN